MFTVKYKPQSGPEMIVTDIETVLAHEKPGNPNIMSIECQRGASKGYHGPDMYIFGSHDGPAIIYVMNDSGATVSVYYLEGETLTMSDLAQKCQTANPLKKKGEAVSAKKTSIKDSITV